MLTISRWHKTNLPSSDKTQDIDYAVMGFAKTTIFNSNSAPSFTPFEPVDDMRKRFSPDTKLMIAIGGWGDSEGFSAGAKDETTRKQYAKNVAAMLDANGFDGVGRLPYIGTFLIYTLTARQTLTGNTPVATETTTRRPLTRTRSTRSRPIPSSSPPSARPLATRLCLSLFRAACKT